jgi:hypothetical protein
MELDARNDANIASKITAILAKFIISPYFLR